MIHIGNDAGDTLGCPLVGLTSALDAKRDWTIGRSKDAYCDVVYPLLTKLTEPGHRLFINVVRATVPAQCKGCQVAVSK